MWWGPVSYFKTRGISLRSTLIASIKRFSRTKLKFDFVDVICDCSEYWMNRQWRDLNRTFENTKWNDYALDLYSCPLEIIKWSTDKAYRIKAASKGDIPVYSISFTNKYILSENTKPLAFELSGIALRHWYRFYCLRIYPFKCQNFLIWNQTLWHSDGIFLIEFSKQFILSRRQRKMQTYLME